jgi:hypothetical protein
MKIGMKKFLMTIREKGYAGLDHGCEFDSNQV